MTDQGIIAIISQGIVDGTDMTPETQAREVLRQLRAAGVLHQWQPIETAPKDRDILVWFDHAADPYQDPYDPEKLTPYAAWAESGTFMDGKGLCVARWFPAHWEAEDEYGSGYWLPAWWFAKQCGDYEFPCNPTHWKDVEAPQCPQ